MFPNLILLQCWESGKYNFEKILKDCFSNATKCLIEKRKYMCLYSLLNTKFILTFNILLNLFFKIIFII